MHGVFALSSAWERDPCAPARDQLTRYEEILLRTVGVGKRVLALGSSGVYASRLESQRCIVTRAEWRSRTPPTRAPAEPPTLAIDPDDLETLRAIPAGTFDVLLCSGAAESRSPILALRALRSVLGPSGRLVSGFAHAGSDALPLRLLDDAALWPRELSPAAGAFTIRWVAALLAAAGYVIERLEAVGRDAGDGEPRVAPDDLDALLATAPDPRIDYYVVAACLEDDHTAVALCRDRLSRASQGGAPHAPVLSATHAEALHALLQKEHQLQAITRTLGWRMLSHYGPYKRRFVLPAYRWAQETLRRALSYGHGRPTPYAQWAARCEALRYDPQRARRAVARLAQPPTISILMPVADCPLDQLHAAIESVFEQYDPYWQLCLVEIGAAAQPSLRTVLERWAERDARITLATAVYATHAAGANAALALAHGHFVGLVPFDVCLTPDALLECASALRRADGDVLYADEDMRDGSGCRHNPYFKPAWSPDLLLCWMYLSRFVLYRRTLVQRVGGFREEYEGAHHYDLALRLTEGRVRVVHVPRILAHGRSAPTVTAGPPTRAARSAGERALQAALRRRNIAGEVRWTHEAETYRVERSIANTGKVTIIVPTRDRLPMLERCVRAVEATDHPNFELVIVDNGSVEASTLAYLARTPHTVIRDPGPFNFSRLNNFAVRRTTGDYLVFLNNDAEATSPGWLHALEEHAQRAEVGAVGAKLLYPGGRIQHAGIALGIGGLAGHPYRYARPSQGFSPSSFETTRNVSAVTAACLMMRREVFDAIGGFDERLPVNSNDVDLCLRLRAGGYLVVYTPHAVLLHHESATRGAGGPSDDVWLMWRRWHRALQQDPYYNPNLTLDDESGGVDLTKPEAFSCMYTGPGGEAAAVVLAPGAALGQQFLATAGDLCAVAVRMTVEHHRPAGAVRFHLRESPASDGDIRTVDVASVDGATAEQVFCFEPVPESAGRQWYFFLEHGTEQPVTVWRTLATSDAMGPCLENHVPVYGTLVFKLYGMRSYRCAVTCP